MSSYPLTNFKIQKYYQNKHRFKCAYSRNTLPSRKDGAYVINLDEYELLGNHCIALYVGVLVQHTLIA